MLKSCDVFGIFRGDRDEKSDLYVGSTAAGGLY